MTAVDEHRELHGGAPELVQRVERGPGGAAGEEHVVDEHHDLARDVGHLGRAERRDRAQPDVVAVERDVERNPHCGLDLLERGDRGRDSVREGHAAGVQADQDHFVGAVVALDDLVRDPGQRPAQIGGVEDVGAQDRCIQIAGEGTGAATVARACYDAREGACSGNDRTALVARVWFTGLQGRHRQLLRRDLTGSPSRSERG